MFEIKKMFNVQLFKVTEGHCPIYTHHYTIHTKHSITHYINIPEMFIAIYIYLFLLH